MNLDSASMAPPVNKLGRPPDVTALTVTKETDVNNVLRITMEIIVVKNVGVHIVQNFMGGDKRCFHMKYLKVHILIKTVTCSQNELTHSPVPACRCYVHDPSW